MRDFKDQAGRWWTARVASQSGPDYKGRFHLVMRPASGEAEEVALDDVRWNGERTARRTLETMSETELRRRLRSGLGRASVPAAG